MSLSRKVDQPIPIKSSEQVMGLIPIAWNEIMKQLFSRPIKHQTVNEGRFLQELFRLWERYQTSQSAFGK